MKIFLIRPTFMSKSVLTLLLASAMILMVGCSVPRTKPANVIDRSGGASEPAPPGYYRVKKGDTLLRIALDHGQSYKDLVQWNNLANPNQIEVGDLIMIKAPAGSKVAAKPVEKKSQVDSNKADTGKADTSKTDTKADDNKPEMVAEPGIRLSWPAKGKVTQDFSESNKGINIAGKLGEPVTAAADGKVVYAGNSLRGYGNLVIVKHDNTYLTAYAYNKNLLVKEGDVVKKGQKIAEMGDTDTNAVQLHFELRVNGKPVNPIPYLQ